MLLHVISHFILTHVVSKIYENLQIHIYAHIHDDGDHCPLKRLIVYYEIYGHGEDELITPKREENHYGRYIPVIKYDTRNSKVS